MTKKRRAILIGILVAAVFLLAGAVTAALLLNGGDGTGTQLDRGRKYLDSGDYNNAVLCYQKAIHGSPEQAEGYIALAKVYLAQNKVSLARSALELGYEKTGSELIRSMLQDYPYSDPSDESEIQPSEESQNPEVEGNGRFNYELLQSIAYQSYDDYRRSQQIVSEGGIEGGYLVQTGNAQLLFGNAGQGSPMLDNNTGRPYSTRRPSQVVLSDISVLLGGRESMTLRELKNESLENVKVTQDEAHGAVVSFRYGGCQVEIAGDEDGTIHSGAWNSFIPSQDGEEEGTGDCALAGMVVDATTGYGVQGAELKLRSGSMQNGTPLLTTTTDASGNYSLSLDGGRYTMEVSRSGFVTEYFEVNVSTIHVVTPENFTLSPQLAEGEIRIVLEWGSYPADLDSWLRGTTDSGAMVVTSYKNRISSADGKTVAKLDLDDIDGYGPETTTIYDINGVYTFDVVDFRATGDMSGSGAVVKIYTPKQSEPVVVNICQGLEYGWAVCSIDHGDVTVINSRAVTHAGANK